MPRKPRRLSSTGIYHIMTRGIDRMAIFHDDEDRGKYLAILANCLPGEQSGGDGSFSHTEGGTEELSPMRELRVGDEPQVGDGSLVPTSCDKETVPNCAQPTGQPAILYNYCLMDNHVHLLIKTGSEPLSHLMKRIGVRYAAFYKWKYHRTGHLFQDRFRSEPVEDDSYLLAVYRYIALNPVKAGLCEKPGKYRWCGCQVEDGSFVPASRDKRNRPQPGDSLQLMPLPVDVTREQLWTFICADAPDIHPFTKRVLDGEAEELLLQFSGLHDPLDVPRLPRQEQVSLFYRLQEEGVSIQQMARLTGIAKTNIARWLS